MVNKNTQQRIRTLIVVVLFAIGVWVIVMATFFPGDRNRFIGYMIAIVFLVLSVTFPSLEDQPHKTDKPVDKPTSKPPRDAKQYLVTDRTGVTRDATQPRRKGYEQVVPHSPKPVETSFQGMRFKASVAGVPNVEVVMCTCSACDGTWLYPQDVNARIDPATIEPFTTYSGESVDTLSQFLLRVALPTDDALRETVMAYQRALDEGDIKVINALAPGLMAVATKHSEHPQFRSWWYYVPGQR